ncbi:MAG: hypothetical protein K9H49_20025 [Bacteroidales bacterium]|nr:hypothetical protein [Bacteroidales bacterium]
MKNIVVSLIIAFLFMNCQSDKSMFDNLLSNTFKCDLPINISNIVGETHKNGASKKLTEDECVLLNVFDEGWQKTKFYSYKVLCYFERKPNLICLVYSRAYYPKEFIDEKNEIILSILNNDGKLISSLPVQGSYGDNEVFFGNIDEKFNISVNSEKYDKDGVLIKICTLYYINDVGIICRR